MPGTRMLDAETPRFAWGGQPDARKMPASNEPVWAKRAIARSPSVRAGFALD